MISQDTLNQLSRRQWLRDTALAATSVVVVPSMLTGCSDHRIPPALGGTQSSEPTLEELKLASGNISKMILWLMDIHNQQNTYEINMYFILKGGTERPSGWSDFITNILLDIAVGIIAAAAAVAETVTAGAASAGLIAGLAITTELIKKFTPEDVGGNLEGVIGEFKTGQENIYNKIKSALTIMASDTDNYSKLKEAFKEGPINFNGKQYTLSDLAKADFPWLSKDGDHKGEVYVALQDAAMLQFKKYFWNVMIAKAGTLSHSPYWQEDMDYSNDGNEVLPTDFAVNKFYREGKNKSYYLRGFSTLDWTGLRVWQYSVWILSFDGRELSLDAATELFKDDTPGNIINPIGLFNRDYVFKQFHREKPDFRIWDISHGSQRYYDLRKDNNQGPYRRGQSEAWGFDENWDFEFTGGEFPQLIKK